MTLFTRYHSPDVMGTVVFGVATQLSRDLLFAINVSSATIWLKDLSNMGCVVVHLRMLLALYE